MSFKSNLKRFGAAAICACMILSATGCNGVEDEQALKTSASAKDDNNRHFQKYSNLESYSADKHLNAKEIFNNLKYSHEMFYGEYVLNGSLKDGVISEDTEAVKGFAEKAETTQIDYAYSKDKKKVSAVPISIKTSPTYNISSKYKVTKYKWMQMEFISEGKLLSVDGAYDVDGKKLIFTPLSKLETDEEAKSVDYELSKDKMTFEFEFAGGSLNLKNGGSSVKLEAKDFVDKENGLYCAGYNVDDKKLIDNIVGFFASKSSNSSDQSFEVKLTDKKDNLTYYDNCVANFSEDGIFTLSWADIGGKKHSYEYVYFYCGDSGIILTDGKNVYNYASDYTSYMLGSGITTNGGEDLSGLDEETVKEIAKKKNSLQEELKEAFDKEGISIKENEETGELMLDSSVLFGVDEYKLSDGGKAFLKKFLKAYSSVILKDDYDGFISKIMVEGHTDSTGDHNHNVKLSKQRADEVLKYCLSDSNGLDSKSTAQLKKLMEAVGYADDYPVLDKNGKEDKDASRRVSFRFIVNIQK